MPEPLVTLSAAKFIWDESRSVRSALWKKLPFAKDAAKRDLAEQELGRLLEDANKLSRTLPPAQAEPAIEKRIKQFEEDLLKAKIPADEVDVIVDRGILFVNMLVTEPTKEANSLRFRVAELERSLESLEATTEKQRLGLEEVSAKLRDPKQDVRYYVLWGAVGVLTLLVVVQLFFLLTHLSGANH